MCWPLVPILLSPSVARHPGSRKRQRGAKCWGRLFHSVSVVLLVFLFFYLKATPLEEKMLSFSKTDPLVVNIDKLPEYYGVGPRTFAEIPTERRHRDSLYANNYPGPVQWFSLDVTSTAVWELFRSHFGSHHTIDNRNFFGEKSITSVDWDYYVNAPSQKAQWVYEFIADTGDSYDVTYAMAYRMTSSNVDRLEFLNETFLTKRSFVDRADAWIFGGDLVYPRPSIVGIMNRLLHPFAHAIGKRHNYSPDVWAIPGNHDWLDGLKVFREIFLFKREETINPPSTTYFDYYLRTRWNLRQKNPWFTLRISAKWFMVGIDDQIGEDIDLYQFKQLRQIVNSIQGSIVLVMHAPLWYYTTHTATSRYHIFVDLVTNSKVKLVIAGDKHHFSYYTPSSNHSNAYYSPPAAHLIVAGGGGAFLHPTHNLKQTIVWPEMTNFMNRFTNTFWSQRVVYPSKEQSTQFITLRNIWHLINTQLALLYFGVHFLTLLFGFSTGVKFLMLLLFSFPLWMPKSSFEYGSCLMSSILVALVDFIFYLPSTSRSRKAALQWMVALLMWPLLTLLIFSASLWIGLTWGEESADTMYAGLGLKEFKNMVRLVIDRETEKLIVVPIGFPNCPNHLDSNWKASLIDGPYVFDS